MAAGGKKATSTAAVAAALVALLVAAAASGVAGYTMCGVETDKLSLCRSYCTAGSTEAKPSEACCAAMKYAQFDCLCMFKGRLPRDIDGNRAMQIPSKCVDGAPTYCKNY